MSLFYQKILLKKSYKFITSSSQKHYYLPIFVKFAILSKSISKVGAKALYISLLGMVQQKARIGISPLPDNCF